MNRSALSWSFLCVLVFALPATAQKGRGGGGGGSGGMPSRSAGSPGISSRGVSIPSGGSRPVGSMPGSGSSFPSRSVAPPVAPQSSTPGSMGSRPGSYPTRTVYPSRVVYPTRSDSSPDRSFPSRSSPSGSFPSGSADQGARPTPASNGGRFDVLPTRGGRSSDITGGRYAPPAAPGGSSVATGSGGSDLSAPLAVGGSVRVVTRKEMDADLRATALSPRDLYDRGTPIKIHEGTRPITASSIADRYRPKGTAVGDAARSDAGSGAAGPVASVAAGKGGLKSEKAASTVVDDRYVTSPPAKASSVSIVHDAAKLSPRPASVASSTTTGAAAALPPRLVPTAAPAGSSTLAGACGGPIWDPCWSWGNSCNSWWYPCSSGCVSWSVGFFWGSSCWGWSSWYPWYCYRSHWGYCHWSSWWWDCWWGPWSPYFTCWSWPVYYPAYYAPAYVYPSEVVVQDNAPAEQPAPERAEPTPAELARKYVDLGDFYFRAGRYAEAADAYARARNYAPDDATIHFVLADAVFAGGDYHFAAYLISEGLRLDPALARSDTDKRLFYGKVADFEQQMQTLMRYLEEKPYDAMAHLVLGYNLKFSGKPKDAEKAFRRVLEVDPDSKAARLFLDALTNPPPAQKEPQRGKESEKKGDEPPVAPKEAPPAAGSGR